jgi:hypothetical protein
MRNKFAFFLALILSLVAVLLFDTQANAQWQRDDRKENKQKSGQERRDQERIIVRPSVRPNVVVRPNVQVYRPSRPVKPNVQVFRAESFSRNDRYYEGNAYGSFAQVARINGYQDGLKEGSKDARDGDRFDPFAESEYQRGTGGYRSSYGDKEAYKQLYRQSFLRGYREAFNRYLGGAGQMNW